MTILTSPRGIARASFLNTPDCSFNPDGDFQVTLVIDQGDELQAFLSKMAEAQQAAIAKAKKENPGKRIKAFQPPIEEDTGDGKVHVEFKMKAKVFTRAGKVWTQRPALFDSKGQRMFKQVGDGSTIKVAFETRALYTPTIGAGVIFRLHAVQVLSLAPIHTAGSFQSFGFVTEEGYIDDGFSENDTKATGAAFLSCT